MNNSLLPVEVCEYIIDLCYNKSLRGIFFLPGSYTAWRQTALVCSAWLPRSRLNLLYKVELRNGRDVDLLLRTLQGAPHLADLVVRLTVQVDGASGSGPGRRYVRPPSIRMPLLQFYGTVLGVHESCQNARVSRGRLG
ncbi:hypothetical protein C8Q76DRAFT_392590 [Earliella scabrosa]|nr:hypothetical protein C8Q76DRAFT_392590 [Earliella scabrosa]